MRNQLNTTSHTYVMFTNFSVRLTRTAVAPAFASGPRWQTWWSASASRIYRTTTECLTKAIASSATLAYTKEMYTIKMFCFVWLIGDFRVFCFGITLLMFKQNLLLRMVTYFLVDAWIWKQLCSSHLFFCLTVSWIRKCHCVWKWHSCHMILPSFCHLMIL